MSTVDFKNYLHLLRNTNEPSINIHWPVIDIDAIEAFDQSAKFGLQLADIAVSGLTWALEPDFYGNCEPRFARSLKAVVYHRGTNYMSYGAKMVPPAGNLVLNEQQQEFLTIYG